MLNTKERIIYGIMEREGEEYTNHPHDSGGPTKWGITERNARAHGYQGRMQDLDAQTAFRIMEAICWSPVRGDMLVELAPNVAEELADAVVHCGPHRPAVWLQRALNVLNRQGSLYADLKVDGIIGSMTVEALARYLASRTEKTLLTALNALQGTYYIELAEQREKDESFVYGWLKNRIAL